MTVRTRDDDYLWLRFPSWQGTCIDVCATHAGHATHVTDLRSETKEDKIQWGTLDQTARPSGLRTAGKQLRRTSLRSRCDWPRCSQSAKKRYYLASWWFLEPFHPPT